MRWLLTVLVLGLVGCGVQSAVHSGPSGSSGAGGSSGAKVEGPIEGGPATGGSPAEIPIEGGPTGGGGETPAVTNCPSGQVQTWRYVADGLVESPSPANVIEGPGGAPMKVTCEAHPECTAEEVFVVERGDTPTPRAACRPFPPVCGSGQFPVYVGAHDDLDFEGNDRGARQSGYWKCGGACELIVVYGHLFEFRPVCASKPIACSGGALPFFEVETEQWTCIQGDDCGGGKYDPDSYRSRLICIPC